MDFCSSGAAAFERGPPVRRRIGWHQRTGQGAAGQLGERTAPAGCRALRDELPPLREPKHAPTDHGNQPDRRQVERGRGSLPSAGKEPRFEGAALIDVVTQKPKPINQSVRGRSLTETSWLR